jgi:hypothetical protein
MKRTLRGTIGNGEIKRLIVDDANINRGFKVTNFQIFPVDMSSGASDCSGVLALEQRGALQDWYCEDNTQIAWSSTTMSTSFSVLHKSDIIDPDHVVIRDLFVRADTNASTIPRINYLVELEEVKLTDDQAVLQLIKEVAQNV